MKKNDNAMITSIDTIIEAILNPFFVFFSVSSLSVFFLFIIILCNIILISENTIHDIKTAYSNFKLYLF